MSIAVTLAFSLACAFLLYHGHGEGVLMANAAVATIPELQQELQRVVGEVKSTADELRQGQKELKDRYEKDGALPQDFKDKVDNLLTKFNELKASNDELEQKLAARFRHEEKTLKTVGEQFVDSAEFKERGARLAESKGRIGMEMKAVNTTAVAGMIRSQRESGIVDLPRERFIIRDLLTTIPTSSNAIDYVKQSTRTNNAAPVAEGVAAAYSDFAWTNATANVRRIAHLTKLSRQAISDAPRLTAEVNSEMRYGLGYVEERQVLYGSGVGENIHGIIPQATAFARPTGLGQVTNATILDILRAAILQASVGLNPADGIVLNQVDWAKIEMLKDADGRYIIGNPNGNDPRKRLWSLPCVDTPAMEVGDFLVGAFGSGAILYDRQSVEIEISTENQDDFEKYMATMSAAERIALAVKRATAFITGDFASAEALLEAA